MCNQLWSIKSERESISSIWWFHTLLSRDYCHFFPLEIWVFYHNHRVSFSTKIPTISAHTARVCIKVSHRKPTDNRHSEVYVFGGREINFSHRSSLIQLLRLTAYVSSSSRPSNPSSTCKFVALLNLISDFPISLAL